jgi:quercetin dioxygenase-like cupin family protein
MRSLCVTVASLTLLIGAVCANAQPPNEIRLTPDEIAARAAAGAGAGTSGVAGIRTTVLLGNPSATGLYTIRLSIPANTRIAAHTHRDERSAAVMSGTWYFGYGRTASEATAKALKPGSFYTEPAGVAHFALTKDEPVVVYITGYGPTDTNYVDPGNDPRGR